MRQKKGNKAQKGQKMPKKAKRGQKRPIKLINGRKGQKKSKEAMKPTDLVY